MMCGSVLIPNSPIMEVTVTVSLSAADRDDDETSVLREKWRRVLNGGGDQYALDRPWRSRRHGDAPHHPQEAIGSRPAAKKETDVSIYYRGIDEETKEGFSFYSEVVASASEYSRPGWMLHSSTDQQSRPCQRSILDSLCCWP